MRPRGEIRAALTEAARKLEAECSAATWRDLAARSGVGYLAARRTVENMERSGELVKVGAEKRAHSKRWMTLYAPRPAAASPELLTAPALDWVCRSWCPRG